MDHDFKPLPKKLVLQMEELHIKYKVTLVRHREWATREYIQRLVDTFLDLPEQTRRKVLLMRDHKGSLCVTWKTGPVCPLAGPVANHLGRCQRQRAFLGGGWTPRIPNPGHKGEPSEGHRAHE